MFLNTIDNVRTRNLGGLASESKQPHETLYFGFEVDFTLRVDV